MNVIETYVGMVGLTIFSLGREIDDPDSFDGFETIIGNCWIAIIRGGDLAYAVDATGEFGPYEIDACGGSFSIGLEAIENIRQKS